jgi:DNA-binding response OmpR family regulator
MDGALRILILEDVATDAELMEDELHQADIAFCSRRVATQDTFVRELQDFDPHLILADYALPAFDGLTALAIAQDTCPNIPFVFVSGVIGEDVAIESLKKGATDYVLKQRLSRLAPSVRRALREAEERTERQRAEEALRRSEERHRVRLELNNAIITNLDRASLFDALVQALRQILSFDRASLALYDPGREVLTIVAGMAVSEGLLPVGSELPHRGSHLAWVLEQKRPFIRRDLAKASRLALEDHLLKAGIRSYMAVPLLVQGQVIGTLNVGSQAPDQYTDEDAAFLLEVAHQV